MKKLLHFTIILFGLSASAQVGIGIPSANIHTSAQLEVASTTKGFLAPRMTEAQKNDIDNPAAGLLVYQTDGSNGFYYFDGLIWKSGLGPQGVAGSNASITLGEIASSPNSNGASITDGILNLAPADINNGGIITIYDQTFGGNKSFTSNGSFNGQSIGKGNTIGGENLAVGAGAMNAVSTGVRNTAIGNSAMQNYAGTSFDNNTSVGYANLVGLTTGSGNTSVGAESMMALTIGTSNTSIGNQSLINTTGNNNVGVGKNTGSTNSTGNNNTIIGTEANVGAGNLNNASAIGYGAIAEASNTIQLGNNDITNVKTSGKLTAGTVVYTNTHNSTEGQVLTTDASGGTYWTTPSVASTITEVADEFTATASQTSFTLTNTPSINSKVKMYVNGIRISNTAYSISGTTLTYIPSNNGSYALSANDRIQFDYSF